MRYCPDRGANFHKKFIKKEIEPYAEQNWRTVAVVLRITTYVKYMLISRLIAYYLMTLRYTFFLRNIVDLIHDCHQEIE